MPSEKDITRISKFMSLVLRHQLEAVGLHLDESGWADTAELIAKMNERGYAITMQLLQQVVATNAKQRFAFNDDGTRIRANQGHSIAVELGLPQQVPPAILYHGTGEKSVSSILQTGLEKRSRQHVHLSADIPTATAVGQRHGKPVVFEITAGQMHSDGFVFYQSENGVWLTDAVPVQYLKQLNL